MALVRVQALDDATVAQKGDLYADVAVTLQDGRRLAGQVERPIGHFPGVPLEPPLMHAKVERCIGSRLRTSQVAQFLDAIERVEHLPSVRDLTATFIAEHDAVECVAARRV